MLAVSLNHRPRTDTRATKVRSKRIVYALEFEETSRGLKDLFDTVCGTSESRTLHL